jgi:hypothetical protein
VFQCHPRGSDPDYGSLRGEDFDFRIAPASLGTITALATGSLRCLASMPSAGRGCTPPTDGYLYDNPAGDYAAAVVGPESPPVPAVVQSAPVQGGYSPNPVYIVINTGNALPATSTDGVPGTTGGYRPAALASQQTSRLQEPDDGPAVPPPDRPAPAPSPNPGAPAGPFDNLALVSWFNENGKDTVLVENTETKDVREITSEPDKDNLRVIAIRPNVNPNLSEVVISNGTDQRAIRFRSEGRH